ncbi:hypothetical protein MJO28_004049 [Puccinia striiformis f. sp. tritici]|uniref:Uncharacterized protein n=2 Tax=Puccinia striiformis TaxID=27350 RepID=A0A2S4WGB3_9BASI|nr:hypothetical protein MJO28_004049 [Puccinia striiformis f. sp. tritici]POW20781.1 hypothetical protein PSHT_03227 [Puccinia striiformis]
MPLVILDTKSIQRTNDHPSLSNQNQPTSLKHVQSVSQATTIKPVAKPSQPLPLQMCQLHSTQTSTKIIPPVQIMIPGVGTFFGTLAKPSNSHVDLQSDQRINPTTHVSLNTPNLIHSPLGSIKKCVTSIKDGTQEPSAIALSDPYQYTLRDKPPLKTNYHPKEWVPLPLNETPGSSRKAWKPLLLLEIETPSVLAKATPTKQKKHGWPSH